MAIGLFPEGTRKPKFKQPHQLLPFKFGAVKMAQTSGAPIIPMAISGRYRLFSRPCIRFGKAIIVKKSDPFEAANERLRDAIVKLLSLDGVKADKLPGRPARNPSQSPPLLYSQPIAKNQTKEE
jgi:1-acyl-sn-glycerol-3-phosphate acyltransferase